LVRKKSGNPPPEVVEDSEAAATGGVEEEADMGAVVSAPTSPKMKEDDSGGRRAQVVLHRINAWTVLRVSLLFYFCVMVILVFALSILYWMLGSMGVLTNVSDLLANIFAQDKSYAIDGGWLFVRALVVGAGWVVVWSLVNMFLALLYNLISDVVGGIKITLAEPK
jgi:Transmembrane domain of unknown function (DUF3566)